MLKFGVVGYGYWGPNIVRNLMTIKEADLRYVCDQNPKALEKAKALYPHIQVTSEYDDLINDPDIDAIAIITPVFAHYTLARKALEAGKHIFIEKPFTANTKDGRELIELADKNNLIIMVDHTFVFTGAVQKMKEEIEKGTLGDLYYYDSTRVSLGLFQHDVNVIWDLAPHDFSIIDYLMDAKPVALSAHGVDHFGRGHINLAYITAYYDNNLLVHINVNWLSPVKVRTTLIGGEKKMLVWDDLETDEKIKIYDKGVSLPTKEGQYKLMVDYRSGDMYSPRVEQTEALKKELLYFIECVEKSQAPINDGRSGLRIVQLLEMTDESLKNNGAMVKVNEQVSLSTA